MSKQRKKHISFAAQRERCRLNKWTYVEKCPDCDTKILMCGYPSTDHEFKHGFCKASTCTSIREIPDEVTKADMEMVESKETNEMSPVE